MCDPVDDGVGEDLLVHPVVPVTGRQPGAVNRRRGLVPSIDQGVQLLDLLPARCREAPVIDDESSTSTSVSRHRFLSPVRSAIVIRSSSSSRIGRAPRGIVGKPCSPTRWRRSSAKREGDRDAAGRQLASQGSLARSNPSVEDLLHASNDAQALRRASIDR